MTASLIFLLTALVHAQEEQFAFDANGNLQAQRAENLALPQIVGQPQPQIVVPGASASFLIVAANTRNLTYQWRFNGADISGATGDALLLRDVSAANEGQYSVRLVNNSGSVVSATASLMLDADRDGLPDSWEQTHFGGLSQSPAADFDRDTVSNLDEYLQGTNPADSASVLFRLTLLTDGGQVVMEPGRFTFTNGEIATLTASAFTPNSFHGWTGDTNSTSPAIQLVMTTNRTVLAHLGSYDITWTNTASGDWHVPSNWSPNFVPASNDAVTLARSVTITLNTNAACGSLNFSSGTLTGSGTLTLHRNSTWSGGTMSGSGRTVIPPGVILTLNPSGVASLSGGRTLENGGTVLWTGGNFGMSGAVITNRAGALFEARTSTGLNYASAIGSRFDNAGTFRKMSNAGTLTVFPGMVFNNYHTVEVQAGTLALFGGGTCTGSFEVSAGTTLNLGAGTYTATALSSITGAGNLTVNGSIANFAGLVNVTGTNRFDGGTANVTGAYVCTNNTLVISGGTANFNGLGALTPAVVLMDSGALGGSQGVTVLGRMNWSGGTMTGSGRTVIPPGVLLTLNPSGVASLSGGRTLENGGTVLWTSGNFGMSGAVITNRAGALFEARAATGLNYNSAVGSRFDNAGTFRKMSSAGTLTVFPGMAFNNYHTVEIQNGILAVNGGYSSRTDSILLCALRGASPGVGYGQLKVAGAVSLNGALAVDLADGFLPERDSSFAVVTAGTRSGAFNSFHYPSNQVSMQLSNTANAVIAWVQETLTVAQPKLLRPELTGSDIRLTWSARSNATYYLQYSADGMMTNWTDVGLPITTLSNTASGLDSAISESRFYRVRVAPQ